MMGRNSNQNRRNRTQARQARTIRVQRRALVRDDQITRAALHYHGYGPVHSYRQSWNAPRARVRRRNRTSRAASRAGGSTQMQAKKSIPATEAISHTQALGDAPTKAVETIALKAFSPHNVKPPPMLAGAGNCVFTPMKTQFSISSKAVTKPDAEVIVPAADGSPGPDYADKFPDNIDLPSTTKNEQFRPYGATLVVLLNSSSSIAGFTVNKVVPPGPATLNPMQWETNVVQFSFPRLVGSANIGNMPVSQKPARYGFDLRNLTEILQLGGVVRHLRMTTGLDLVEIGAASTLGSTPDPNVFTDMSKRFDAFCDGIRSAGEVITMSASTLQTTHGAFSIPADQTKYGEFAVHNPVASDFNFMAGIPGGSAWKRNNKVSYAVAFDNHVGWDATSSASYTDTDGNLLPSGLWKIKAQKTDSNAQTYAVVVKSGSVVLDMSYETWNALIELGTLQSTFDKLSAPRVTVSTQPTKQFDLTQGSGFTFNEDDQEHVDALTQAASEAFLANLQAPSMSIHVLLIEAQGDYATYPAMSRANAYEFSVKQQTFGRHPPNSLLHSVSVPQPTAEPATINKLREAGEKSGSFLHTAADAASAVLGGMASIAGVAKTWGPSILGAGRAIAGMLL